MADGFRASLRGVREALSQPAVYAELARLARSKADAANAAARSRAGGGDAYRSYTTRGNRYGVALGIVTTAGERGEVDEALHKTLEGLNH